VTRNSADVIIIGAGIVGVSAARALARSGLKVLVLDRGEPCGEASRAAAGMLAPQIEAHAASPLLALGLAARDRFAELAVELSATGHDIGYWAGGIAHVAFDDLRAEALREQAAAQVSLGLDSAWLSEEDLRRRHPSLSPAACGALLAPRDGCVNAVALGEALIADARALGVTFAQGEVCEVTIAHGQVTGVRSELDSARANAVVVAAGAWSAALVGLPRGAPVEPVRGQMAAVPWPASEPPAVLFSDEGYLVARGGEALLGSTMEKVGFVNETTPEGLDRIRRGAARLVPSLGDVPFTRTWSGLRPMSADGLPIIGVDPNVAGLVFATGHGRNGILFGPLTGEIVRDLIVHRETPWDIAPYSITRFWG
jgi:glycine oxidase